MKKIIKLKIIIFIITFTFSIFPSIVSASAITETTVFNLTNNERVKYNVHSLSWNYKLAQAARNKAQDMINKDYFSHNSPDGRTPWNFINSSGYNYIYAGENLAMSFDNAEDMMVAWMNSGGHRANILSTNFKEIGVGVVTGEYLGYTTTVVVQMFGSQATAVYGPNKTLPSKNVNKEPVAAQPVVKDNFDYNSAIVSGTSIIKRRIEDFQKACDHLNKIVNEG